ncbi:IQ domain-containing protein N [Erinaceus europaeus]|uniref:IQ domain-containing protein N n=1 Tax=Erinaceus europaeus TaxID=9365 RepID=A0ABM3WLF1_ERIEU|nr:IQ domain-containing protein N [Erinaceus europaeus]
MQPVTPEEEQSGPPRAQLPGGDGQGAAAGIPRLRALVESRAFKNILVDEVDILQARAATLIQTSWRRHRLREKLRSQVLTARAVHEAWRRLSHKRLQRRARAGASPDAGLPDRDIPYHAPRLVRFRAPDDAPVRSTSNPGPAGHPGKPGLIGAPVNPGSPGQPANSRPMGLSGNSGPPVAPGNPETAGHPRSPGLTGAPVNPGPPGHSANARPAGHPAAMPPSPGHSVNPGSPGQPANLRPVGLSGNPVPLEAPGNPGPAGHPANLRLTGAPVNPGPPGHPTNSRPPGHPANPRPMGLSGNPEPPAAPGNPAPRLMAHKETQCPSEDTLPPASGRPCLLSRLVRGVPAPAEGDATRIRTGNPKCPRAPASSPRSLEGHRAAPQACPAGPAAPRTCPPPAASRTPPRQPATPRGALPTCLTALLSRSPPASPPARPAPAPAPATTASRTALPACLASLLSRAPGVRAPGVPAAACTAPACPRPARTPAPGAARPRRPAVTVTTASLQHTCRTVTLTAAPASSPPARLASAFGRTPNQLRSMAAVLRALCVPGPADPLKSQPAGPARPRAPPPGRTLQPPAGRPKSSAPGSAARPPADAERPRTLGQKATAAPPATSAETPVGAAVAAVAGVAATPSCSRTHSPHPLSSLSQRLQPRPATPRGPCATAPEDPARPLRALTPPAVRPACSVESWGDGAPPPPGPGGLDELDLRALLARVLAPAVLSRPRSWAELGRAVQGRLLDSLCRALSADERAALGQALCQGELGAVLGPAAPPALALLAAPLDLQLFRGGPLAALGTALCPAKAPLAQVSARVCWRGGPGARGDAALLLGSPCRPPPSLGVSFPGGPGLHPALRPALDRSLRPSLHLVLNPALDLAGSGHGHASLFCGAGPRAMGWDLGPLPAPVHPTAWPSPTPWKPLMANGSGPSAHQPPEPHRPATNTHRPQATGRVTRSPWAGRGALGGGAGTPAYPYTPVASGGIPCSCQGPWPMGVSSGGGCCSSAPKNPHRVSVRPKTPQPRRPSEHRRAPRKGPPSPAQHASKTSQGPPPPPGPLWTLNTRVDPSLLQAPHARWVPPATADPRCAQRAPRERERRRGRGGRTGPESVDSTSQASTDSGPARSSGLSSCSLSTASEEAWAGGLRGALLAAQALGGTLGGEDPSADSLASHLLPVLAKSSESNLVALSVRWGPREQPDMSLGPDHWPLGWTRGAPRAPCKASVQRSLSLSSLMPLEPPRPPGTPGLWHPGVQPLAAPFHLPFSPLKMTPSFSEPTMFSVGSPTSCQLSGASGGVPSFSPSQTWVASGGVPMLGQPPVSFGVTSCLPQPPMTFGVTPSMTQLPMAFEVTPSLAQPSVATEVTPIQAQPSMANTGSPSLVQPAAPIQAPPSLASTGMPSLAQPPMTFGVASMHTQSCKTSVVSPSVPHPHMLSGVTPTQAPSFKTDLVTPYQKRPSVTFEVTSIQGPSPKVNMAAPTTAPSSETNMAAPISVPSSKVNMTVPIPVPLSEINMEAPTPAPSSETNMAVAIPAPSSKVNMAVAIPAPSSKVNMAAPIPAPSSKVNMAAPIPAPSSETNMAAPIPAPSSKVNMAVPIPAPSSKVNMAAPIPDPSSKVNMAAPIPALSPNVNMTAHIPVPLSETNMAAPTPAPSSETNMAAPIPDPWSKVNTVAPIPSPSSKVNMAAPVPAPSSETNMAAPTPAPSSKVNMAVPIPAPSSKVNMAVPIPAPSSKVNMAAPIPAPSSETNMAAPIPALSSKVNLVTPSQAQSAVTYGVTPIQAPSSKTSMLTPSLVQPSRTHEKPSVHAQATVPLRVTPSPAQHQVASFLSPVAHGRTPSLTQPSVASGLFPGRAYPPLPPRVTPSPTQMPVPSEGTPAPACSMVASQVASSLFSTLTLGSVSSGTPGRGPRAWPAPEPPATLGPPTFTVDVCYSRPCLPAVRSVAGELSQASVGVPSRVAPPSTGLAPNPQAPHLSQQSRGLYQLSGEIGKPPDAMEMLAPGWQRAQGPRDTPRLPSPPPCRVPATQDSPQPEPQTPLPCAGNTWASVPRGLSLSTSEVSLAGSSPSWEPPDPVPPVIRDISQKLSSESVIRVITGVARGLPPPYPDPEKGAVRGGRGQPPGSRRAAGVVSAAPMPCPPVSRGPSRVPPHSVVSAMVADLLAGTLSQSPSPGSLLVGITPRPFPGSPVMAGGPLCGPPGSPQAPASRVPCCGWGAQARGKLGSPEEHPCLEPSASGLSGSPPVLEATPWVFPSPLDDSSPFPAHDWPLPPRQGPLLEELALQPGAPGSARRPSLTPWQSTPPVSGGPGAQPGSGKSPPAPSGPPLHRQKLMVPAGPRPPRIPSTFCQGPGGPSAPQHAPESPPHPRDFSAPPQPSPARPLSPESHGQMPACPRGPPCPRPGSPSAPRGSPLPTARAPESWQEPLGRRKSFRFMHGACPLRPPATTPQAPRCPPPPRRPRQPSSLTLAVPQEPAAPELQEELVLQAAVTIQAGARGFLVRRTVRVWHQWALVIQAAWRGHRVRSALGRQVRAAVTIQAGWRGFSARRLSPASPSPPAPVAHRCFLACAPSACGLCRALSPAPGGAPSVVLLVGASPRTCHTCGQTLPTRVVQGRGRGGAPRAPRPAHPAPSPHAAATVIQAAWRGFAARRQLQEEDGAARRLQATWRGARTRLALNTEALLQARPWDGLWPGV